MKYLLEMILVAVLIVVLYQTPSFLSMHLNTILGKLILVSVVGYLAMNHGLNAGLLGSFIVIVLLNSSVEGFKEGMDHEDDEKEKSDESEETEEENEEGKTEKKVDEDDEEEDDEDEDDDDELAEQSDDEDEDDELTEQEDDAEDEDDSKEGYSNINRPLMGSAINLVDQDRMFKVNAIKNNQKSRGITNGVVNDVKGLLNRVSRLELLQEDLESEMMEPDNLESY